jgi:hypothetical protein
VLLSGFVLFVKRGESCLKIKVYLFYYDNILMYLYLLKTRNIICNYLIYLFFLMSNYSYAVLDLTNGIRLTHKDGDIELISKTCSAEMMKRDINIRKERFSDEPEVIDNKKYFVCNFSKSSKSSKSEETKINEFFVFLNRCKPYPLVMKVNNTIVWSKSSDVSPEEKPSVKIPAVPPVRTPAKLGRSAQGKERSEVKPLETKPPETKPLETKPPETKPPETKPPETSPAHSQVNPPLQVDSQANSSDLTPLNKSEYCRKKWEELKNDSNIVKRLTKSTKTFNWGAAYLYPHSVIGDKAREEQAFGNVMGYQGPGGGQGNGVYLAADSRSSSGYADKANKGANPSLAIVTLNPGTFYIDYTNEEVKNLLSDKYEIKEIRNLTNCKIPAVIKTDKTSNWFLLQTNKNLSFRLATEKDLSCNDLFPKGGAGTRNSVRALEYLHEIAKNQLGKCQKFYSWDSGKCTLVQVNQQNPGNSTSFVRAETSAENEKEKCPVVYEMTPDGCTQFTAEAFPDAQFSGQTNEHSFYTRKLGVVDPSHCTSQPRVAQSQSQPQLQPQLQPQARGAVCNQEPLRDALAPANRVLNAMHGINAAEAVDQLIKQKHRVMINGKPVTLDQDYFSRDMGGSSPNNTLKGHTEKVLNHLEDYLARGMISEVQPPDGVRDLSELMRGIMLLHDIGKPQAAKEHKKETLQHPYTLTMMDKIFKEMGWNEKEIQIAKTLTDHDIIGSLFKYNGDGLKEAASALKSKAQALGMSSKDFFALQALFYCSDATAYHFPEVESACTNIGNTDNILTKLMKKV